MKGKAPVARGDVEKVGGKIPLTREDVEMMARDEMVRVLQFAQDLLLRKVTSRS